MDKLNYLMSLPVEEIGLSTRAVHALRRYGTERVEQMLNLPEEQIRAMRNVGVKTVDEILQTIEKYKNPDNFPEPEQSIPAEEEIPSTEDPEEWLTTEEGQKFTRQYLENTTIDALPLLSARAYNLLSFSDRSSLSQLLFQQEEELMKIPYMDDKAAKEIVRLLKYYLKEHTQKIFTAWQKQRNCGEKRKLTVRDLLYVPEYHEAIALYVKANDEDTRQMDLTNRARNRLVGKGFLHLSDFVFATREELLAIKAMGVASADEILSVIDSYFSKHENRILALINGDEEVLLNDETIQEEILREFCSADFRGLSLREISDGLQLPAAVPEERVKSAIGSLLAAGELEYVDFRCYRVYGKFEDELNTCTKAEERNRKMVAARLNGDTLEEIGSEYGLTRERARQIIKKTVSTVSRQYSAKTKKRWFDEDYYRYLYSTYELEKKDSIRWLGIPQYVFNFMEIMDVSKGDQELRFALEDSANIDAALRLRIKNYLNRSKIFVDNQWIERKRPELEKYVIRKFCGNTVAFEDFIKLYNDFLSSQDIPYDENIYYTEEIINTRKNHLRDERWLLWTWGEKLRYYEVDGRDYSELLETLSLDSLENTEISALKLFNLYPEIMEKYDLRDQYELHNLLRKIIPEGSMHDFHCGKTPHLRFGEFDRDAALLSIIRENSPIRQEDLLDLLMQEYGYDPFVCTGSYLKPFSIYYHNGAYDCGQKQMPEEHRCLLDSLLQEDFYFIEEVKQIFSEVLPDADPDEINSMNLKLLGFSLYSNYILKNYPSSESYFRAALTREEITDLAPLKKRYAKSTNFSVILNTMKRNLEIVEFEPGQLIAFTRLARSGVTHEQVAEFCDAVFDFLEEGEYFSIQSIRNKGFRSELDDLGFSPWFYANLLLSDERFSYGHVFNCIILCKGKEEVTIQAFEYRLISEAGSIDVYDLMSQMKNDYGCQIGDRWDILYRVQGTAAYYDDVLDRFYVNEDTFYRELDRAEEY